MKVSVLGWYDHANVGDEAFKPAFSRLLPGHDLRFFDAMPDDEDVLILGGGDVVHRDFTRFVRRSKAPRKIAASVTVTSGSDVDSLSLFEHVYVRDQRSLALARSHVDASSVSYLPDATFLLRPDPAAGRRWLKTRFDSERLDLYEHVVIVVMSSYASFLTDSALARDYVNALKVGMDIGHVADATNASFVFLPFSTMPPHDDRISNGMVSARAKYHRKNCMVHDRLGVQETLDIISCADAVVSSRLHSSIFATISGVPFIDLTHHDKNAGFVESIGKLPWSIPFWDFNMGRFRSLLGDFVGRPRVPDVGLMAVTEHARELLANSSLLRGIPCPPEDSR